MALRPAPRVGRQSGLEVWMTISELDAKKPRKPLLPHLAAESLRSGRTLFAVTGATGWLGRATLAALDEALGDEARIVAYGSRAQTFEFAPGRMIEVAPICDLRNLRSETPVTILHYAFVTKDRVGKVSLSDFVRANTELDDHVAAALAANPLAGLFLPSSGAVYAPDRTLKRDLSRDPYGAMKVEQEQRFEGLMADAKAPCVVARVFNLSGPYINKHGAYALASIINDVLRGGPIELRASQPVIRSYVHVGDLIALALAELRRLPSGAFARFDTAGEIELEVGALATRVAAVLGASHLQVHRPPVAAEPIDRYVGDGAEMAARMNANGFAARDLDAQIRDTAAFLSGGRP